LTLVDLKKGEEAVVKAFSSDNRQLHRLREMGMSAGTSLKIVRFAPLGDPIAVKLRGFQLSVPKSLARLILVEKKI